MRTGTKVEQKEDEAVAKKAFGLSRGEESVTTKEWEFG